LEILAPILLREEKIIKVKQSGYAIHIHLALGNVRIIDLMPGYALLEYQFYILKELSQ
jgi:hypothetical protein